MVEQNNSIQETFIFRGEANKRRTSEKTEMHQIELEELEQHWKNNFSSRIFKVARYINNYYVLMLEETKIAIKLNHFILNLL